MNDTKARSLQGRIDTVFLDRDGVINEKRAEGEYVTSPAFLKLLPGVAEAIRILNQHVARVIVLSNQRGVALGLQSESDVVAVHAEIQRILASEGARIDRFYYCPHDCGECNCRKPRTGLFDEAKAEFPEIVPSSTLMVGDSLSDIEFGRALGLHTIFINGNPQTQKPGAMHAAELADCSYGSLLEAAKDLFSAQ